MFQLTPGTEAPAEMNSFFPSSRRSALPRIDQHAAQFADAARSAVRDAKWAGYLNETIAASARTSRSNQAPLAAVGQPEIIDYRKKHRDLYKYLHDQTVHLMNEG